LKRNPSNTTTYGACKNKKNVKDDRLKLYNGIYNKVSENVAKLKSGRQIK
jgi:hypothetical protein